tara:strand:+ start:825 stop:1385 length:561 start_codon:yes stop_codon:yes gene_type:complete
MFIQTESTPNPNSLKFILDNYEFCSEPVEFSKSNTENDSPLATDLFRIEGVENILFNKNLIIINKSNFTWEQLKASILQIISKHISSGLPLIINKSDNNDNEVIQFDKSDLVVVNNIKQILSAKIRPAVMQDGGDIKFKKYEAGIVYLSLQGSCAGCPSATITLKNGIENMLKQHIPEIKKVEQLI